MIDLLIVLAFIAYSVGAGLRARRRASVSLNAYFLADRTVVGWRAGVSMAATQFAADTPLLVVGLIATGGVFLLWRLWIYALAFLLMAFVFGVLWRRAGVLTDAELTEIRYSGRGVLGLRVLKAVYYGTVVNCVVMAMVLVAAVRIAEVFLPWHEWLPAGPYARAAAIVGWSGLTLGDSVTGLAPEVATTNALISILLILFFIALYSTAGGLRGVVATDVVQFAIAILGSLVYAVVIVRLAGGLDGLSGRVVELYGAAGAERLLSFRPRGEGLLGPFLAIVGLQWLFQMNSDGTGYLAQRSIACATDRDARIAGLVFAWAQILLRSLIWLVIGVGLLVLFPFSPGDSAEPGFVAGRELLFVTGADRFLPAGARGLMLTALLAALASTIDTHLNWGASYWSHDLYGRLICGHWRRREPTPRELVLVARLSNLLILAIALAVMVNLGSIQTAWTLSLLFGAGMGAVLVLRWLWERINLYSELAAIIVSLAAAPILLLATDDEWLRLAWMAGVSTAAAIAITWLTPPTDGETLRAFYLRVRPVGFWGRTAGLAGEDPRIPRARLWVRLRLAALCSLSLLALLVGCARLMIPAPGGSPLAPWLWIGIGLASIPSWWRDAVRAES